MSLSDVKIIKVNNSLGNGSNKQRNNIYTTSYEADAIFIIRHKDNEYSSNIKLKNITFSSDSSIMCKYAIYAPFLVDCEFENLKFENCNYGIYGYCWYLIPTIKNLKGNKLKSIISIVDDGTHIGSSTSINMSHIYGTNCENVVSLFGLSYSILNIPCGDFCTSYMMSFTSCKEITVNSPSTEHAINGNFAYISNSSILINSPNAYKQRCNSNSETYMLFIDWYSRVIINNGTFENFTGDNPQHIHKVVIKDNAHLTLNNTKMPTNGNGYQAMTNKSSITINDENGRLFSQLNGDYILIDKIANKQILQSDSPPKNGTWNFGDICYNNSTINKNCHYWTCISEGTPGLWRAVEFM